ncbi:MAG: GAF domain-containing protein [Candidatus Rokubacteria bacterium]|nr:GAF domain-containing protein [Candidatus Rokubacteria bacterium]
MRRSVCFDPGARAAVAAAALIADAFDVAPCGGDAPEDTVLLVGGNSGARAGPGSRIVALVDALPAGPWPEHWYTLMPAGAPRDVVARAVENAFAALDAARDIERLQHELGELNAIGIGLTADRDPDRVLDTILSKARAITCSDAGSLYLVEGLPDGTRGLRFVLTQNDTTPVPFRSTTLPLDHSSVAGHVALTGEPLNLPDAYAVPADARFRINPSYDQQSGYRTKSMLAVPMKTPKNEIIGVLQLINCKPSASLSLASAADVERLVQPFGPRFVQLASSLASQGAAALLNRRLYDDIRRLFEGFVQASVIAIEARDPTTAGHSFRVADLTMGLAQALDRVAQGPLAAARLERDALRELRYAALLHDFGKVAVREDVLGKAKKLRPEALERIRYRADLMKRELELRCANRKLQYLLDKGPRLYPEQATLLDAELAAAVAELDDCLARVLRMNEPTVVVENAEAQIEALAHRAFEDRWGARHPIITADEAEILRISRGSLTPHEYVEVRSHVVHTFHFLAQIPWTHELRRVPEIARDHHEKLDGSGYPRGVTGDAIPLQTRMMTIADIYDALTAFDRPYKPAVAPEIALDILEHERGAGRIDGDLLALFVRAKVYELTRRRVRSK